MSSISTVLSKSGGPYSQPLRVKVLARDATIQYKGNDGSERQSLPVAVTDGTTCCRLVCYDPAKFAKLMTGQCIVMREVIVKKEEAPAYLVATRATKIFMTGGVTSTAALEEECRRILNPPPAAEVPIVTALKSPIKQKVSVRGKLIQEENLRAVKVRGEEVKLRTVTLEDDSGRTKLTLWREAADCQVRTGDFMLVTDCVLNVYRNETSLSTTTKSKIEKTDAPLETGAPVGIEGVSVDDGQAELLTVDNTVLCVPAELLASAFGEAQLETITDNGPVTIKITKRGNDIIQVERCE